MKTTKKTKTKVKRTSRRTCAVCGAPVIAAHMRGVVKGTGESVLICLACAEEAYMRARIAREKAKGVQL
jgi:RNase P subunit RPR2